MKLESDHPMQKLLQFAAKPVRHLAGLISGTSADGIDAALVRLRGSGEHTEVALLAFQTYPYPQPLRTLLLEASTPGRGSVDLICRLNTAVGECFAQAALQVIAAAGLAPSEVDAIGSHGQTIHHLPRAEPLAGMASRGTLQIGEPSVIARRTGVITVADFRPADMACGGQGAPLVPLLDYLLLRAPDKTRGILNLGGIANLTLLLRDCRPEQVLAFDTGPANMVVDALMQQLFQRPYDDGGRTAAQGRVAAELLSVLLKHDYFARPLPKSTGREEFGEAFVAHFLALGRERQLPPEDLVATATALTAESVRQAARLLERTHGAMDELIVSGGGAHNRTMMQFLRERFAPGRVTTSSDYGIPVDAKEAILFAVLANETLAGRPGNLPAVTGASARTVLGKICF